MSGDEDRDRARAVHEAERAAARAAHEAERAAALEPAEAAHLAAEAAAARQAERACAEFDADAARQSAADACAEAAAAPGSAKKAETPLSQKVVAGTVGVAAGGGGLAMLLLKKTCDVLGLTALAKGAWNAFAGATEILPDWFKVEKIQDDKHKKK